MNQTLEQTDLAALQAIVMGIQNTWNTSDGAAYAADFTEDADFVNIFGMYGKGRQAIADAHDMIFRGVYKGSVLSARITRTRLVADDVALLHLESLLRVPQGPLAGEMKSVPFAVVKRTGTGWKIAAFQNTLVQAPPALQSNGQN